MTSIMGICDLNNTPSINLKNFKDMTKPISHAGKKDSKPFYDKSITLHARLNTKHTQPVTNKEGTVTIIGDIRCFNKKEINLDDKSDLEICLHLYEKYGEDFIKRVKGVFSFALWDDKSKRLLLYKDRMGTKPLFYYHKNKELVFCSEQKGILKYENYKLDHNPESVRNFLAFRYNYSNNTLFEGIKKIPAGHYLKFSKEGIELKRYYQTIIKEDFTKSESYFTKKLRHLLLKSTEERLEQDEPVAAFMSGGVDSGGVVGLLRQFTDKINTFSVGFAGYGFDELERAKKTAEFYGTTHTEINIKPDIMKEFPKIVWQLDEPMADLATVPNYVMSKHTKDKKMNNVFSGETNDEVWGGYEEYVEVPNRMRFSKLFFPGPIGRKLAPSFISILPKSKFRTLLDHCDRFYDPIRCYNRQANFAEDEEKLYSNDFIKKVDMTSKPKASITKRYINHNTKINKMKNLLLLKSLDNLAVHGYIVKQDRTTRSQGLNLNLPLIDSDIVDFSFTIPFKYKVNRGTEKYIYRQALKGMLPPSLLKRKKRGFDVPTRMWIPELKEHVSTFLDDKTIAKRGLFKKEYINRLTKKINNPNSVENQSLWNLVVLELWFRIYFDGLDPNKKLF